MHLPKLGVLLIGTNDLSNADCTQTEDALLAAVPSILTRMNGVLGAISNAPHIAIVGILPRSAAFWVPEQQWIWPNRYTNAIKYINEGYAVRASPKPALAPALSPVACHNAPPLVELKLQRLPASGHNSTFRQIQWSWSCSRLTAMHTTEYFWRCFAKVRAIQQVECYVAANNHIPFVPR